jgi:hypothetical protein
MDIGGAACLASRGRSSQRPLREILPSGTSFGDVCACFALSGLRGGDIVGQGSRKTKTPETLRPLALHEVMS